MRRLVVYLNGERVGTLDQDDDGLLVFRYGPEWLGRSNAVPLSRSLPLRSEPFSGRHARPFFAGILPDEGPRRQIAAVLGISEDNDFAMLERLGGECAGAVSLWPEGAEPPPAGEQRVRELDEQELWEIIVALPHRPLMAGHEGVRLSLAGSQEKLPIVVRGTGIALPLGSTPSTHIIKPEPERFPGLVANEVLCMTLAGEIGLNVARTAARRVGGKPCIVVERYDRISAAEGGIVRAHQEDFCQALGLPPERKYQQEGGPPVRDCISLLRQWSTAPVLDVRDFIDGLVFNALIGNADAHGKNYSITYRGAERRLAPFYDLVCTLAWPDLSRRPAMKIGGSDSIRAITAAHWKKMSQETRLGWPMVRERIERLCRTTLDALQEPGLKDASGDSAMFERISGIVAENAARMLKGLPYAPRGAPSTTFS
ncbi:MAG: type II toxin-antitoxin system HipA family toxin [Deltaproteobacteria bacterium]|nr:type II toxin-antitoxin system HipA family toxin [Deltaproteobacteria bacterium]